MQIQFSMTGQEKSYLFNADDCLIKVTAWVDLTVYLYFIQTHNTIWVGHHYAQTNVNNVRHGPSYK